jgi:signal transduction histidine kinase
MILLPLLDQVLAPGLSSPHVTVRIAAHSAAGRLHIEITDSGTGFAAGGSESLAAIQDRLRAIYGDSGMFRFGRADGHGTYAIMEIPHESTDCRHR